MLLLAGLANEEEERMQRRLILIVTLSVLAAMTMQTQKHEAQSATSTVRWPTVPIAEFTASTEKTFNQLMGDAVDLQAVRGLIARDTPASLTMTSLL